MRPEFLYSAEWLHFREMSPDKLPLVSLCKRKKKNSFKKFKNIKVDFDFFQSQILSKKLDSKFCTKNFEALQIQNVILKI